MKSKSKSDIKTRLSKNLNRMVLEGNDIGIVRYSNNEIIPKIGLGPVHFGMRIVQVTALLGKPDFRCVDDYEGDINIWYNSGILLSFYKEDDFMLEFIEVDSEYNATLFGVPVSCLCKHEVLEAVDGIEYIEENTYEDMGCEEEGENVILIKRLSLCFYFDYFNDKLTSINIGPIIDEHDNVIWPNSQRA